jgi:AcrR family transcriptional regulator
MSTLEKLAPAVSPFEADTPCEDGACAKDRIFEAAKKLFYKSGIRGVSVDAIASEANTTKVTLYRVFSSKEELVVKVLEEQASRWQAWWDEIVGRHPGEPRRQLEAVIAAFCDEISGESADRGCSMANAAVEIDDDHPGKLIIRDHKLEMARRMRELCREMGARDPEQLGNSLMLLFSGAISARLVYDGRDQIAAIRTAARVLIDSELG